MSCEEMRRRRSPLSPAAAPPLENDDLLPEILLRLPPQPSSLPRASVVCKQWRRLVSFPAFLRHFRIHHRYNPPLLGFFAGNLDFVPTMEPPNRVPGGRFSLQLDGGDDRSPLLRLLGCRHGLVLMFLPERLQLLVWDPVTSDQHPIAIPPGFAAPLDLDTTIHGAVLRGTGDAGAGHFQVVIVGTVNQQHHARAVAQVYSSETGVWGNPVSTPLPPMEINSTILLPDKINTEVPCLLVEDSLYWLLCDSLLKFDLYGQRLGVIHVPLNMFSYPFSLMRADGGGLGCFVLSKLSAQLWKREIDCDGAASWVLGKTIELDKILSINSEKTRRPPRILGFAEENNVVLLWTDISLFTIQVESLQIKKLFKTNYLRQYYAFESVYTPGTVIGGGHHGAEILHNT